MESFNLGIFYPTLQWSLGRRVYRTKTGRYLRMESVYGGYYHWSVQSYTDSEGAYLSSCSGTTCPASQRATWRKQFLHIRSWMYESGPCLGAGDVTVHCSEHKIFSAPFPEKPFHQSCRILNPLPHHNAHKKDHQYIFNHPPLSATGLL